MGLFSNLGRGIGNIGRALKPSKGSGKIIDGGFGFGSDNPFARAIQRLHPPPVFHPPQQLPKPIYNSLPGSGNISDILRDFVNKENTLAPTKKGAEGIPDKVIPSTSNDNMIDILYPPTHSNQLLDSTVSSYDNITPYLLAGSGVLLLLILSRS